MKTLSADLIGNGIFEPQLLEYKATKDHYTPGAIPKTKRVRGRRVKKGTRVIQMPIPELKELQRSIIKRLEVFKIGVHDCSFAYRKGVGVSDMAKRHIGHSKMVRIDVKDFFGHITWEMVSDSLPKSVPKNIRRLIQNWCFLGGTLPAGAPSSPLLSNIAMYKVDSTIVKVLKKWRVPGGRDIKYIKPRDQRFCPVVYSRYCDDLIFSSDYGGLNAVAPLVTWILEKNGLPVNRDKTRFANKFGQRQYVVGCVVNEKLSTPKDYRKRIRSDLHRLILDTANGKCDRLHALDIDGQSIPLGGAEGTDPFRALAGQIEFVRTICEDQGNKLGRLLSICREVHTLNKQEWSDGTLEYVNK